MKQNGNTGPANTGPVPSMNFVIAGIFKSGDPAKRAVAIVKAVTHYNDPYILAEVSRNLGEPMVGRNVSTMPEVERIAGRGW